MRALLLIAMGLVSCADAGAAAEEPDLVRVDAPTSCPAGQAVCSDGCVDLSRSDTHCGACGVVCPVGTWCEEGNCHGLIRDDGVR